MFRKIIRNSRISPAFLFLFLSLLIYFSFGLFHLAKFETADEHFWIDNDRIADYWRQMGEHDWKGTRINNKPGITLAYISGIGMFFDNDHSHLLIEQKDFFSKYNTEQSEYINFIYRLPILIFNGLFSLFFFWVVKKLTNNVWISLWTASLILLSPILLGISQIVNPDSLSWQFCAGAIFSFLLFLKDGSKKAILLTALFLGLALATKYIALILFYFLFYAFLAHFIFYYAEGKKNEPALSKKIMSVSIAYLGAVIGGFLVFSLLMPAVFVRPKYLFSDIINFGHTGFIFWTMIGVDILIIIDGIFKGRTMAFFLKHADRIKNIFFKSITAIVFGLCLFTFLNWITGLNLFNLEAIPFDSRQSDLFISLPFWQKLILQARPLVFSLTPIVLAPLMFIWVKAIFGKLKYGFLIHVISAFIFAYWIAVTFQNLLTNIRYGIILQPMAIFIAVLGIWEILHYEKLRAINKYLISTIIISFSVLSLWMIKPFYFDYTNIFLPNTDVIAGAWGYGGYEAAQYLNSLPDSGNQIVISDYNGVCPFTKSPCAYMYSDNIKDLFQIITEKDNSENIYYVITRRGQLRWGYISYFDQLKKQLPLWELEIDSRPGNFIRVYRQF